MQNQTVAQQITDKLNAALKPVSMTLRDDSDRHIGHAGHDGRGESHFHLEIVAAAFAGRSRVERHRMIYNLLGNELQNRVHALSIKAYAPDENT